MPKPATTFSRRIYWPVAGRKDARPAGRRKTGRKVIAMRNIRSTAEPSSNPNDLLEYSWHLPVLSREEERELLRQAQDGDAGARHKLLKQFHGFAKGFCKSYFAGKDRAERSDIIQAAMIGLNKAIDRFDLSLEWRFTTYARQWMRKFILLHFEGHRRVKREMATWAEWSADWADETADEAAESGDRHLVQFHRERAEQLRGDGPEAGPSETETDEPMIPGSDDDGESIAVKFKSQRGTVMDHAGGWGNGEQADDTVWRDDEITAPERAESSNGEQGEHKAGSDFESWPGPASEGRRIDPKSIDLTESFARLQAKIDRNPQPGRKFVKFKPRRRKAAPVREEPLKLAA